MKGGKWARRINRDLKEKSDKGDEVGTRFGTKEGQSTCSTKMVPSH